MEKERLKKFVKERYSKIAETQSSCCSTSSCCGTDPTAQSKQIGYSREDLEKVPQKAIKGLGCGNPVNLLDLKEGEKVLDLGSGLGIDVFLASENVDESGTAVGIDASEDMVRKAKEIARENSYENVEFKKGEMEELPFEDESFDAVISNCVINLSTDKLQTYNEIYRVLKPGGRILISDIVGEGELPEKVRKNPKAWAACIGGAMEKEDYLETIKKAGFEGIKILSQKVFEEMEPIDARAISMQIKAKKRI